MKGKFELSKEIGQKLKELRKEKGVSQAELARRTEKDPQSIEIVENGKTNPTIYTLYLLCHSIDADIYDLFN